MTVGCVAIAASLLPLLRLSAWCIRILDFPRPQVAVLLALTLAAELLIGAAGPWRWPFAACLGVCLFLQGRMIFPYTPLASKQVQDSRRPAGAASCRLLFANVLMDNRSAEPLRAIIRRADADVILIVEADPWWQAQLRELERTHPHTVHRPLENTYGMLLYSRLELIEPEVRFIVEDDIPSIHARLKLHDGTAVQLHCLHPRPPFPTEDTRSTKRDAELLIVAREAKATKTPTIVMGDLNDVAWSHTNGLFQEISGLLDPRIGRGFFNTFHARWPGLRFALDHCFHSNHFRLIAMEILPSFGSDHFPVLVALSHEPEAARQAPEPQADAAATEEAEQRIAMSN